MRLHAVSISQGFGDTVNSKPTLGERGLACYLPGLFTNLICGSGMYATAHNWYAAAEKFVPRRC